MKSFKTFCVVLVLAGVSTVYADVPFSYTSNVPPNTTPPMLIPAIPGGATGEGITVMPLVMSPALPGSITSLELVLNGISHADSGDLNVYLIDPFGHTLEVMTDRGNGGVLANATLAFSDSASQLPPLNGNIPNGTYLPEGPTGFAMYNGGLGGTDSWILLLVDDSPNDIGAITSFTLRGTAVPEPVTLSLLALGALTTLRRRRSA